MNSFPAYCDVVVLGAGPAGIATALTLQRHAPHLAVLVVSGPLRKRDKMGETLPPGTQAVLASLGLWEAFLSSAQLPAYGTSAVWGHAHCESNEFIFHPDHRGWHIDRQVFNSLLIAEAENRGIPLWSDASLGESRRDGADWRLSITCSDGRQRPLNARFVVDATGRAAVFGSRLGAQRQAEDRLVAISVSFRLLPSSALRNRTSLVEACPAGWWYSALLPGDQLVVAWMTDADLARQGRYKEPSSWLAAVRAAPHTCARLIEAEPEGTPVLRAAESGLLSQLAGNDWLATGDAASTFDPLAAQGILKAFRQGTLAAYALADHLSGEVYALAKYSALLRREYHDFLVVKRDFYLQEARWTDRPFWARRQSRSEPLGPATDLSKSQAPFLPALAAKDH